MRFLVYLLGVLFVVTSCDISGVKELDKKPDEFDAGMNVSESDSIKDVEIKSNEPEEASDTLKLDNGIIITFFKRGKGEKLKKGDVIKIDYRAKLKDGTVFDGNHIVKKPWIPFLVGWKQQTSGWDIAMEYLREGDDVDIFLPSKYARGEKGIKGIVPPNADNTISLRVIEKMKPIAEGDGIRIWKYDELKEPGDSIGFKDEVFINYWASSESNPRYDNNYKRGEVFKLVMGDGNIVPGLYKALYYGREGDRLLIKIPPEEAYGKNGLHDLVKPNESIFYDIQIAKVNKAKE